MPQVKTTLQKEDLETLENISRETGISISGIIRVAVKQYLRERKEEVK